MTMNLFLNAIYKQLMPNLTPVFSATGRKFEEAAKFRIHFPPPQSWNIEHFSIVDRC